MATKKGDLSSFVVPFMFDCKMGAPAWNLISPFIATNDGWRK